MKHDQKQWPGFTPLGEYFRVSLEEIAKGFITEGSGKAKRAGVMIKTLTSAMKEDSHQYYSISMEVYKIYGNLSNDWNNEYVKMGGELGTGKIVKQELDGSGRETILSQYPSESYMKLQLLYAGIRKFSSHPEFARYSGTSDFESMRIMENLVCTIYMAILMEEKWFNRVERAIINTASQSEPQLN